MQRFRSRSFWLGLGVVAVSLVVYWLSDRNFDAGRGDFFYLADSFLHGHTWISVVLGPYDVIFRNDHVYVPFAPFPAFVLAPIVALTGPQVADQWETGINAALAAIVVGLSWWVAGVIGVRKLRDKLALALLLGFSTQIWWVTTRGGVWHTGQLIATIITLFLLAELFGRQRAWLIGLLVGLGFLTRAPLAFAGPVMVLWLVPSWEPILAHGRSFAERVRRLPWRRWIWLGLGFAPALAFFLWYNADRFGSPLESGYALATLPDWLEAQREQGLFSLSHVGMNFDYLFTKIPDLTSEFPWYQPDGLGMSVFITSPGLLLAIRAPWRDRRSWFLLLAAGLVLIPTLLYYGGGWLQYGYRYFLDSIPFVWALVALGVVHRGPIPWWGWLLILFGVLVGLGGVYWAYHLL